MHLVYAMVGTVASQVITLGKSFPAVIFLSVWELCLPCYGPRPKLASQLKGILFQLVSVAVGSALIVLMWNWLPYPRFTLWPALALPLAFLIGDCLLYWEHRLEHHPVLWRFHAIHHCTEDLTSASNFSHVLHNVFMSLFYGIPVGLITRDPLATPALILLLYVHAAYLHSPAKIPLGPLRWIINDNRVHRIHHSVEERHWHRNFGAILTVWDWAFGTMYWPAEGEWPETGVPDYGEIDGVWAFLMRPFPTRRPSTVLRTIRR